MTINQEHQPWCRLKMLPRHTDAAKRLSDHYNLHRVAAPHNSLGKWIAAALHDGATDRVLYDSKRDAVRHQHHNEQWYTYIRIVPSTMTPCEAEVMLTSARNLYEHGMRLTDPDHRHGGLDIIKRTTVEDQLAQGRGVNRNLIMPWEA